MLPADVRVVLLQELLASLVVDGSLPLRELIGPALPLVRVPIERLREGDALGVGGVGARGGYRGHSTLVLPSHVCLVNADLVQRFLAY